VKERSPPSTPHPGLKSPKVFKGNDLRVDFDAKVLITKGSHIRKVFVAKEIASSWHILETNVPVARVSSLSCKFCLRPRLQPCRNINQKKGL
jgi:hypothetical protein